MTVEPFVGSTPAIVTTIGPYAVLFDYLSASDLRPYVLIDGVAVALPAETYSIDPAGPAASGNLWLTPAAAADYSGRRLWVERLTVAQQGFQGLTAREAGLEAQLDATTLAVQELQRQIGLTLRLPGSLDPAGVGAVPVGDPGMFLTWGDDGSIVSVDLPNSGSGGDAGLVKIVRRIHRGDGVGREFELGATAPSANMVTVIWEKLQLPLGTYELSGDRTTVLLNEVPPNDTYLETRVEFPAAAAPAGLSDMVDAAIPATPDAGMVLVYNSATSRFTATTTTDGGDYVPGGGGSPLSPATAPSWVYFFNSRADLLAARIPAVVHRVGYLENGRAHFFVASASNVAATTADGRTWAADGAALPTHFATNANPGVTDVAAALNAALDTGDLLVPPEAHVASERLTTPAGATLTGQRGATVTRPAGALAGPVYMLDLADGVQMTGGTWAMGPDEAATNGAALWRYAAARDVRIEGITADGGVLIDAGTGARNSNTSLFIVNPDSDLRNVLIAGSTFTRFFWGILQANSTLAEQRHLRIVNNRFDEFGSTYLLFNAPTAPALVEDVLILGNQLGSVRSRQPFGGGAPGFPHRGSLAGHVEYTRILGNHAFGYGGEFFRAEEAAFASIWSGNTAKLDGKDGIEIIPNNAGGTLYSPKAFIVGPNVLVNAGLVSAPSIEWGIGLHVYTSVSGLEDAETLADSVVAHNIVAGWKYGLSLHQGAHRTLVAHNVSIGDKDDNDSRIGHVAANVGIRTFAPSFLTADNVLVDHDTAIEFARGGVLGPVHIRSDAAMPDPPAITVTNGPGGVTGWTWETSRRTYTNATTVELELMPLGSRIDGTLTISVADDDGTHHTTEVADVTYDGTTLVYYRRQRFTTGTVLLDATAPCGIKNSNLAIAITAGATADDVRVQVKFDGLHVWS